MVVQKSVKIEKKT